MKIAVIDYGMGNLGSVSRALIELDAEPKILDKPDRLNEFDRVVLPGVGSFADGMKHLEETGWVTALSEYTDSGKPLLGICLGMQLLATHGTEAGDVKGLNFIPGHVKKLDVLGCDQRIPHMGWNNISLTNESSPLFKNIPNNTDFYFVHSYAFDAKDKKDVIAEVDYGVSVTAAVSRKNIFGVQFHPEKSSKAGFQLIKNFIECKQC